MHDALGNALAIEALQLLDQLHVLQQGGAVRAGGLRILVVAHQGAVVAREGGLGERRGRYQRALQHQRCGEDFLVVMETPL